MPRPLPPAMKHPLRKHPGLLVPRAILLLSSPLAAGRMPEAPVHFTGHVSSHAAGEPGWRTGGWELSAFGGSAATASRDVYSLGPGSTNLSVSHLPWEDESLQDPPYYGLRATYWLPGDPRWGLSAETAHASSTAEGDALAGSVFDGRSLAHESDVATDLATLGAHYRWLPTPETERCFLRDFVPYVGAGAGVAFPRGELGATESVGITSQVAGPALQAVAGASWRISDQVALFAEYKLSWSDVDARLVGGVSPAAEPWTQRAVLGLSWTP